MASPPTWNEAVPPGTVLLGKYRIDSILGKGGMGIVAEATHIALEEKVAIKLLRSDVSNDAEACQRFLREAQAAVKLKSEHVARVTDVGTLENGSPYMVMEFLEGVDLDQMLTSSGVIAPQLAVDFVLQASDALAEAHSLGIVHRDVKPSNFFVTWRPDGTPLIKVLDFGISKAPVGMDLSLTRTQSVLGTPAYMSPEQMRSARTVDARTDLWSLGTVLYELIEGQRPFEAESFSEMCVKVAADPPDPMKTPDLPPGLEAIIFRCLEKDPARRFQNIGELAEALAPYARDAREAGAGVERMKRTLRRPRSRADDSSPSLERPAWPNELTPAPSAPGFGLGAAKVGVPLAQASRLREQAMVERTPTPSPVPVAKEASAAVLAFPRRNTTPYAGGGAVPGVKPAPVTPAPIAVSAPDTERMPIDPAPLAVAAEVEARPAPRAAGRRIGVIVGSAVAVVAAVVVVMIATGGGGTEKPDEPRQEKAAKPAAVAPKPAAVVSKPTPPVLAPPAVVPPPTPDVVVATPDPVPAVVPPPTPDEVAPTVVVEKKPPKKKPVKKPRPATTGSGSGSADDAVFGKRK